MQRLFIAFTLLSVISLQAVEWFDDLPDHRLMRNLMIAENVDRSICDRMPVYYNHLLLGGYFNMPSARVGCDGDISFGYTYVPPYRLYNARFQITDRLEISGNYRVFKGVDDPTLSQYGFGDLSDKGANFKLVLFHPEDSDYTLPGIAFGYEDFIGTRAFKGRYLVFTQVLPQWNLEATLGFGEKRIRGLFGGVSWMPFRHHCNQYLRGLAFVAEHDAIPYQSKTSEPHPAGRNQKYKINYGLKYRLWEMIDASVAYIRGEEVATSISAQYNFNKNCGFITKIDDPLPYRSPVVVEPIGPLRTEEAFVYDLYYPFRKHGFELYGVQICSDTLRLKVMNQCYRCESTVRCQLTHLIGGLVPENISTVIVEMMSEGFSIQEYRFPMNCVRRYQQGCVSPYELEIVSPLCEVSSFSCADQLFKQQLALWEVDLMPKIHTFFGSATGKLKYAFGAYLTLNGFLPCDVFYTFLFGYNLLSDIYDIKDVDRLNPSQIINVRTDLVNYIKQTGVTMEEAFLQKSWNLSHGFYARIAAGCFERAYGGVASELLYYPINSCWAAGIEGAWLKKRTYDGWGFTNKVRKLDGFDPHYVKFNGYQYFASIYYHIDCLSLDVKLKAGSFLAHDQGLRTELIRYFPSGLRLNYWYTRTDAKDEINGHRYHDYGIGFSLPLDMFYTTSSRNRWGYGLSAWLRDVGQTACTGLDLYSLVREQRE